MKSDIIHPEVKDIALAVIPEENDFGISNEWSVFLLNLRSDTLMDVLIVSEGYGIINGEDKKTSVLRQHFEKVDENTAIKIEMLISDMIQLTNQFWVSFYIGTTLYDKKYIFVPESINPIYFTTVPVLEKDGVMIR